MKFVQIGRRITSGIKNAFEHFGSVATLCVNTFVDNDMIQNFIQQHCPDLLFIEKCNIDQELINKIKTPEILIVSLDNPINGIDLWLFSKYSFENSENEKNWLPGFDSTVKYQLGLDRSMDFVFPGTINGLTGGEKIDFSIRRLQYNKSKIIINNGDIHSLFLEMACGGLVLVEYDRWLEEFFINKYHLVWFHDLNECQNLIKHYLKRPEEREKIADQGSKLTQRNHSYINRVGAIIDNYCGGEFNSYLGLVDGPPECKRHYIIYDNPYLDDSIYYYEIPIDYPDISKSRGVYGVYKKADAIAKSYGNNCLLYQFDQINNEFINGELIKQYF